MRILLLFIALILAGCAFAQKPPADYPAKPVRLVVPFAAGSATDSAARILANELAPRLGRAVIVEPRPGAFGQIAAQHVARSAADGYTVFMTTNTTHSANPHLYRKLSYDPIKQFDPVVRVGTLPFMLLVHPGLPAKTTAELLAYARANPDKLTYGNSSSASLVSAETIKALGKISMVGVPYKASPQAMMDIISGRVQVMVADFATAMPHAKAGKVRVLGVTTAKRSTLLPDTPPIADTLPGFDVTSWNGLFVPAGTPTPIIARLEREMLAILKKPDIRGRLAALGYEVDPLTARQFRAYVQEQIAHWGRLIRTAGIQPE